MAVLPYDLTEEERLRLQQEAAGGGAAGSNQPAAGTEGGSDIPAPPSGFQSPQAAGRSSWVDVASYLDANRDQAQTLAGKVAGDLTTQGQGLRSDIDAARTGFKEKVTKGSTAYDEDLMRRATENPLALSDEEKTRVKSLRDASYAGPENFMSADDYTSLLGRTAEATERAKGVDTESGRESILTGIGTNPTKGQVAFNQLLIGADPNARAKLSEAAKPFEDLNTYLDTAAGEATGFATKAKADTEAARTRTQEALQGATTGFQENVNQRLAAARQDALARANAAKTSFQDFVTPYTPKEGEPARAPAILSDQQLADLGIKPEDAEAVKQMLGLLASEHGRGEFQFDPYFTQRSPDVDITAANIANAEDYQRLAALEDLMGSTTGFLNTADPSMAGTANLDVLDFQGDKFRTDADRTLLSLDEQVYNDVNADPAARQKIADRRGWGPPPTEATPGEEPKADYGEEIASVLLPSKPITEGATRVGEEVLDLHKDVLTNPKEVGKKVEKELKNVVDKINPFCFAGVTPVTMADGTAKPIRDIKLGDRTAGGEVIRISQSLVADGQAFDYKGVMVTGMHAVKENGRWIRVKDSLAANPVANGLIVYSLVTPNHRIFVGDIEFADEVETDHYEELTIDQSLAELNGVGSEVEASANGHAVEV